MKFVAARPNQGGGSEPQQDSLGAMKVLFDNNPALFIMILGLALYGMSMVLFFQR